MNTGSKFMRAPPDGIAHPAAFYSVCSVSQVRKFFAKASFFSSIGRRSSAIFSTPRWCGGRFPPEIRPVWCPAPYSEAVPIGAGTYLDGKFFVWLCQKLLKSVRIPASFFLARQKFFSPICIPSPIGTASNIGPAEKPHIGTRTEGNGKRVQANAPAGGWRSWPG